MLESVVLERCGGKGIILVGEFNDDDGGKRPEAEKLKQLKRQVGVGRTVLGLGPGKGSWIEGRNELVKSMDLGRKSKVWICEGRVCKQEL